LKGHLDLLILATLRGRPAHGYAIAQRLAESSSGVFDLGESTLYPALHRLQRRGFLASDWAEASGRKRRVYRLTPAGIKALAGQRKDWERFQGGVQATLEAMG
jgi:transcriptional regulator